MLNSDYIVYVDESGDHSMEHINQDYPLFVLALCIFDKKEYANQITPKVQNFKFKHFGHDMVVLHEREIRKAKNNFSILTNADKRQSFMDDLSELVEQSPFSIIGSIVRKDENKRRKKNPTNPYELSIKYVLQILYKFLKERNQNYFRTYLVFESRGKKEDKELKNIFTQVYFFQNIQKVIPFEIIFASKYTNSCGLQLADLVARPIG